MATLSSLATRLSNVTTQETALEGLRTRQEGKATAGPAGTLTALYTATGGHSGAYLASDHPTLAAARDLYTGGGRLSAWFIWDAADGWVLVFPHSLRATSFPYSPSRPAPRYGRILTPQGFRYFALD